MGRDSEGFRNAQDEFQLLGITPCPRKHERSRMGSKLRHHRVADGGAPLEGRSFAGLFG